MEVIGFRVNTKVGSFDVINKEGALIVWSKGKALKSFTGINPADKDSIIKNKYENRKSSVLINADVTTLGPIPVLKERNDVKLLETMIKQDVFKKIVEF